MCSLHVSRKVRLGSCRTPLSAENITIVRITWPPLPCLPRVGTRVRHAAGSLYKLVICLVRMFSLCSAYVQSAFSLCSVQSSVFTCRVYSLQSSVIVSSVVRSCLRFLWINAYRRGLIPDNRSSGVTFIQASVLAVITLSFTLPWVVFSGWDRKCDVM